jgi:hypothetical protein
MENVWREGERARAGLAVRIGSRAVAVLLSLALHLLRVGELLCLRPGASCGCLWGPRRA